MNSNLTQNTQIKMSIDSIKDKINDLLKIKSIINESLDIFVKDLNKYLYNFKPQYGDDAIIREHEAEIENLTQKLVDVEIKISRLINTLKTIKQSEDKNISIKSL